MRKPAKSAQDLLVWQKARYFALAVYCAKFRKLTERWIDLAEELSILRLEESRSD